MRSYAIIITIAVLGLLSALVVVSSDNTNGAQLTTEGETQTVEQDIQDIKDMMKRLEIRIVALESDIFGSTGISGNPFSENSVEGWISELDARLDALESSGDN